MENAQEDSESSSYESSDEEADDLILEGVLVRNAEVPSSDEDDSSNNEDDDEEEILEDNDQKQLLKDSQKHKISHATSPQAQKKKKKGLKKDDKDSEDDLVQVEFTFHDMDEKFFHGLKMLLLSAPIYAPVSSALADEMIENISVGTVVSCDDGGENVYGFASVLPIVSPLAENNKSRTLSGQEQLIQLCMDQCPEQYKAEMKIVTSGSTQRPAGIFLHGRMVNLPLEITFILHQQLVLDMDWAVDHAEGGEAERKALDFGAFVLFAPCYLDSMTQKVTYKNFDDEIFAGCAEFVYAIHPPPSASSTAKQSTGKRKTQNDPADNMTHVIVLTKTGHRQAMKQLNELIHGRTPS
jgi:hypothetical protein